MSRDVSGVVRARWTRRRERIATQVLAGLYANPAPGLPDQEHMFPRWAVEAADALLLHLAAAESRDALEEMQRRDGAAS